MQKAFFAYQYGLGNAGDFAINIGSLDLLEDYFNEITIVSKLTKDDEDYMFCLDYFKKYYPKMNIIEGPFNLRRKGFISTFKSYIIGMLKYPILLYSGKCKKEVENSDIVFLNGGNILRCEGITDYVRLFAFLFPLSLARKNNTNYVLLPQSTTSINNRGKKLLKPFLKNAKIVFAREDLSYKKLKTYFPDANILNSLDTAFFIKNRATLKNEYRIKYNHIHSSKGKICITLRKENIGDIGELNNQKRREIEKTITILGEKILKDGYSLVFVVQTKKDKEFTENMFRYFKHNKVSIIEEYDPLILREIYRDCLCLFGMRLHSLILAMSVETPVVGYFDSNWGNKNPGTLEKFGMPFGFINDNSDLYSLLEKALKNHKTMISSIAEAKENVIKMLKNGVVL